jgi:hypothetical protein
MSGRRAWAATGALAVTLFGCGLLFGDLLGSSNYPPLNASYARVSAYFLNNSSDVRLLALFHVMSALALLCFAAYLHDWLRNERTVLPRRTASLALAGGALGAAFLLLSALIYRALAEPVVAHDRALTHGLVVLSYLAGGPAVAIPLALPIGAGARAALRHLLLPRWTGWLGAAAVVASLLSAATLLGPMNNSSALYGVLLTSAVLDFGWIFVTSVLLSVRT